MFNRGVGAYKTNPQSVRPSVKSPEQWAYSRVNSFLYVLRNGKFRSGKHDTDLLPKGHPMSSKRGEDMSNDDLFEEMEERHIVDIQETDDAYVITYAKIHDEDEAMEEERFSREDMSTRGHYMDKDKSIDKEKRRVKVGVSTEEPVQRSFGMEVIDHSKENMNLEFLNSGRAPLLLDHDMTKQVGVIERVELDETARRLRAEVRFGKGALASEVFNDVADGIRQNISVGYRIDGRIERDDDPEEYYRVATTPMEISVVSVPADQSSRVGVGRTVPAKPVNKVVEGDDKMTNEVNDVDLDAVKADAVKAARKNDAEILELGVQHNKRDFASEAIKKELVSR